MSEEYPQPAADWRPKCHNHAPDAPLMEPTILQLNYPRGSLPVRGFRCPHCGDDAILGADGAKNRELANSLGLFGPSTGKSRRKLMKTGTSIGVTLDRGLLREFLGTDQPGRIVVVSGEGRRIVIELAADEAA